MFGKEACVVLKSDALKSMDGQGTSVTLIFYKIGDRWWREPMLNVLAAAAQMSNLTHVEVAIGETAGTNGMMANVCRVFNDNTGVVRPLHLNHFGRA